MKDLEAWLAKKHARRLKTCLTNEWLAEFYLHEHGVGDLVYRYQLPAEDIVLRRIGWRTAVATLLWEMKKAITLEKLRRESLTP